MADEQEAQRLRQLATTEPNPALRKQYRDELERLRKVQMKPFSNLAQASARKARTPRKPGEGTPNELDKLLREADNLASELEVRIEEIDELLREADNLASELEVRIEEIDELLFGIAIPPEITKRIRAIEDLVKETLGILRDIV